MSVNKKLFLALIFLLIVLTIPNAMALDDNQDNLEMNQTVIEKLNVEENNDDLSSINEEDVLNANNDYYFDASAENDDGDGSAEKPYKYLTSDRIKAYCNIHLANGEYTLDNQKQIQQVRIMGDDPLKTIIKYDGNAFYVNNYLELTNLTLNDLSITNYATLNVTNTIFNYGYGNIPDSYHNNYGGAIYTDDSNTNAQVTVKNSTFANNYAAYGGAIYMGAGSLIVEDSRFISNYALNYGGAIACENTQNIIISKSKFIKSISLNDAGGAVYIKNSNTFKANNIEIINSSATFGGAITTLNTKVELKYVNAFNNTALWDGGAIYHMYGEFSAYYCEFTNNTARNGGALYVDNSTSLQLRNNKFLKNNASNTGGAVFSLANNLTGMFSLKVYNTFKDNVALNENDIYESATINLTIGDGNFTLYKFKDIIINNLPAYYSLIKEKQTTTVKDQQSSGNCWAFTAMAVLESCLKKITGIEFDLSEENMKNIIALYSDYGWKIDTNDGGYDAMPFGYFTSWLGPINESQDGFDDKSVLSPVLNSILHIQNILFLKRDNFTANDEIKTALMKYGAVGTSMYFDNYYLNQYKSYYCWSSIASNHAVTIVGWDDNYSKDNFKFSAYVPGDGAWIVKNSWGPYWGEDGYFYVSYYDESFAKVGVEGIAYTFILNDTYRYDKNYQYDIAGKTDYLYNNNPSVWYKNRFTATDDESLKGVSTYFEKQTKWALSVYVNNVLKSTKSGISNAGYYTIDLDDIVSLEKGDVFEVVFNTTGEKLSSVPISEIFSLNKIIYSDNISFISYDGVNWIDLFDYVASYSLHNYHSQVACIKAFTIVNKITTSLTLDAVFNDYNPVSIIAEVIDADGNPVDTGYVVFNVDGDEMRVNVTDGHAVLVHDFKKGLNNVSAIFKALNYKISSSSISFEVLMKNVELNMSIDKYQNNVNVTVNASIPISKDLTIELNGNNYTVKLVNGTVAYCFNNLLNGEYNLTAYLDDNVYESGEVTESFLIDVKNTRIAFDELILNDTNFYCTVILTDMDGNRLNGKEMIFKINNSTYTVSSDEPFLNLTLDKGTYTVDCIFSGDQGFFESSNTTTVTVRPKISVGFYVHISNQYWVDISYSKPVNDTVEVSVNGTNVTIKITEGYGFVTLGDLENGIYSITVESVDYNLTNNTHEFSVSRKITMISADDLTAGDDGLDEYEIILSDEDGNFLEGQNILFVIDKEKSVFATTDAVGRASFKVDLAVGAHEVEVYYYPALEYVEEYRMSENASEILVKRNMSMEVAFSQYIGNVTLNITFSKKINETANITFNGKNSTLEIVDGRALIRFELFENNDYALKIFFDDYEYYKNSFEYDFTLDVTDTTILAEDFTTFYKSGENYKIRLVDEDGIPVKNASINVSIDNEINQSLNTNDEGFIMIPISLSEGNYHVEISADGFGRYRPSKASANITVTSSITFQNDHYTYNAPYTVILSGNLTGKQVNVTINSTLQEITVKENQITFPITLNPGSYLINITNPATGEVKTQLIKVLPRLAENKDIIMYYGANKLYTVKAFDDNGVAREGQTVHLTINTKTYHIKTDKNGMASLKLKGFKAKKYTITVEYNGFKKTNKITVKPTLITKDKKIKKGKKIRYQAKLLDKNGKPLKGKKITFKIKGKTYKSKTNKKGIAKITVKKSLKAGKYKITAKYGNLKSTSKITIKK